MVMSLIFKRLGMIATLTQPYQCANDQCRCFMRNRLRQPLLRCFSQKRHYRVARREARALIMQLMHV